MPSLPLPSSLGQLKRVAGTQPGAGVEVTQTVPAGKAWWVISVTVQLVQGITQTPLPFLIVDDGTTSIGEYPGSTAAQAVSTTCTYSWSADVQVTGQIGATPTIRSTGPLPSILVLPSGYRIRTATQGIGANSAYGVPSFFICELG
jgi:hypothetical protein